MPAGWGLPDSDTCSAAWTLAFDVSPAFIANHCVRSYLFARELAAANGLRSGVDYDDELVFLACLLHDLGVTEYGTGDQRFEVEGADAAVRFLREQRVAEDRANTVWQAIALHTSVGLAERFGPEQSVAFQGISLDINGFEKDRLSAGLVERINATWPRHNLGYAIADLIAQGTQANPLKAPPFSFPAHLHQLINSGVPVTFFDLLAGSPWGDQPVTKAALTS
ncbi:HD domain-containing protein [Mycobacterium deserti]